MRLLITGGAGFMGSNFIRYILNKYPDYKIVNLDKLTYAGNLENLRDIDPAPFSEKKGVRKNPNYKFIKGDICDEKIVDMLAKEADIIINYAAETHVDQCRKLWKEVQELTLIFSKIILTMEGKSKELN